MKTSTFATTGIVFPQIMILWICFFVQAFSSSDVFPNFIWLNRLRNSENKIEGKILPFFVSF